MNEIAPLGPQQGSAPGQPTGVDGAAAAGAADPLTQAQFKDKLVTMLGQQIFDIIMDDDGL